MSRHKKLMCEKPRHCTGEEGDVFAISRKMVNMLDLLIFKALALWADAFYKSICPSVRVSVCLCVCSLLKYRLNVFLPPLPEVGRPLFLEIRNPWGKVMERSGLTFEHFCSKVV